MREGLADGPFLAFLGMLATRMGDPARAIPHLRRGIELMPQEMAVRIELGRAYLSTGDFAGAEALLAKLDDIASGSGREAMRIRARALLGLSRATDAAPLFEALVQADERDFESWDGLGTARLALGDRDGSIEAARRAVALSPTAASYLANLGRSLNTINDFEGALDVASRAVERAPDDVPARLVRARALAGLRRYAEARDETDVACALTTPTEAMLVEAGDIGFLGRNFEQAEGYYRRALAINGGSEGAWLGIGKVLERRNRSDELMAELDAAEAAGIPGQTLAMLRAKGLRAQKRWVEALAIAQSAPDTGERTERYQLIGDIADRLGQSDVAFSAFSEANRLLAENTVGSEDAARDYLDRFNKVRELLTPGSFARWRPLHIRPERRAPLFIFGFPRSGTTLIDTMLSGHPDAVVIEEELTIDTVAAALGSVERIPGLDEAEARRLIRLYYAEADKHAPDAGNRLIVDKQPLGLGSTPLLYRLFPDARFLFVERHPCDVVLSCFITSARMDADVASFHDFEGTARLYDSVLSFWQRVREVLPIHTHSIRYETLIGDPETELRALADFAGLEWTPQLMANEANAAARSYIGSPSYAQVAEPIYTRAKGRWLRYREQMEPVIPILRPWIEKMGYDLE